MGTDVPRTRLAQLMQQRHITPEDLREKFRQVSRGDEPSERQVYRWIQGELKGAPYPHAQAVLERIFGEPVARLLGPPYGVGAVLPVRPSGANGLLRGHMRDDWQGQLVTMSAERARDFLNRAEATNVGSETLDQLADDVRQLAIAYQQQPLESLLADMSATQDRAFGLLEGRQRPLQSRDLYLLAGVASGLMARASHDLGAPHDAMTQARAAYTCADNAGHDGLKAWSRGLQSLIAYWAGRFSESVRYAREGTEASVNSRNTATVWLAAGEARALAAQSQVDQALTAINRAQAARDNVQPDDLDEFGGLCTFNRPRQLYYAAEALAWTGTEQSVQTERFALEALEAYETAQGSDRAFGDEAGARCALAMARIMDGQLDGAADALIPVLELPVSLRTHGVVTAVQHVNDALMQLNSDSRAAGELAESIHTFATQRLVLSQ
ncbi:hypothetical protein ACFWY9_33360 [Amycolatopsis sp. NPDC059027]|uniref:hypothetical protein n=1 Tax=Amycolatopsis sp. NPDC059027 TaxID=3346709 RepID=UPI0036716E6B